MDQHFSKNGPKMFQKWSKMVQKWSKNSPKIVQKWFKNCPKVQEIDPKSCQKIVSYQLLRILYSLEAHRKFEKKVNNLFSRNMQEFENISNMTKKYEKFRLSQNMNITQN